VIKDNGVGFGIFENNIKDILNPYFTTKEKGTGLGLAIVNKIINDHYGSVSFKSLINGAEIQIKFKKQ
jgi:two-component system nitrogen regulation sensor histidine kinase NtrY